MIINSNFNDVNEDRVVNIGLEKLELDNNDIEYFGWMNLVKMTKLTSLSLNLTSNNIE